MKTIPYILSLALMLGACETLNTNSKYDDGDFFKAIELVEDTDDDMPVEVVERVEALPLPGQMRPVPTPRIKPEDETSPREAIDAGVRQARMEPSADGYMNAVQVYPYTEGALYRLYCAPGQVSDIALQPGEELISVSAGDTVRWVVGDTSSGGRGGNRAHVLVKPIASDLNTNLMIATDRRTYHLELESTRDSYMAALSWRYPQDELEQLTARNDRRTRAARQTVQRDMSLEDLNFDYRIEGDEPDWRPIRVFDDGNKVFIQMPDAIAQTDAPPLFVLGRRNEAQLVNYRVHGKYYIVDRLFTRAELRLGERNQTVVRILKGTRRGFSLFRSGTNG